MDNLDDLLRLVTSPAYFFDRESHQILACNQQFATLMEYEIKDLLTMFVEQLRPPEEIPLLARALAASPPKALSNGATGHVQAPSCLCSSSIATACTSTKPAASTAKSGWSSSQSGTRLPSNPLKTCSAHRRNHVTRFPERFE